MGNIIFLWCGNGIFKGVNSVSGPYLVTPFSLEHTWAGTWGGGGSPRRAIMGLTDTRCWTSAVVWKHFMRRGSERICFPFHYAEMTESANTVGTGTWDTWSPSNRHSETRNGATQQGRNTNGTRITLTAELWHRNSACEGGGGAFCQGQKRQKTLRLQAEVLITTWRVHCISSHVTHVSSIDLWRQGRGSRSHSGPPLERCFTQKPHSSQHPIQKPAACHAVHMHRLGGHFLAEQLTTPIQ